MEEKEIKLVDVNVVNKCDFMRIFNVDNNELLGRLFLEEGKLTFEGEKVTEAAQVFFDNVLKIYNK